MFYDYHFNIYIYCIIVYPSGVGHFVCLLMHVHIYRGAEDWMENLSRARRASSQSHVCTHWFTFRMCLFILLRTVVTKHFPAYLGMFIWEKKQTPTSITASSEQALPHLGLSPSPVNVEDYANRFPVLCSFNISPKQSALSFTAPTAWVLCTAVTHWC